MVIFVIFEGKSVKSVAFFNNKGGVGKTTLLCNVAAYASLYEKKKVCVIDADPQCNATQYFFGDDKIGEFYSLDSPIFTIARVIDPIRKGETFLKAGALSYQKSVSFDVDVLIGDPRLALGEDFLAGEWSDAQGRKIRGIKNSLVFSYLFKEMEANYDLILVDVGPSLGAINRAVLLSCDYFLSPMSIDIFSLRAFDNISQWIKGWWEDWDSAIAAVKPEDKNEVANLPRSGEPQFLGYVTQAYLQRKDRPVKAYENIKKHIDEVISDCDLDKLIKNDPFEIGSVPNFFSLIPLSQLANKPVFELQGKDGVVGSHFEKVKDAKRIFEAVTEEFLRRIA